MACLAEREQRGELTITDDFVASFALDVAAKPVSLGLASRL